MNSKEKVMTGTCIYPCVLFQPPSNFNFLERFEVLIPEKKNCIDRSSKFSIVNSKEKGMTIEILLSEDLIDVKAPHNHRVGVLMPYLFVLVCLLI